MVDVDIVLDTLPFGIELLQGRMQIWVVPTDRVWGNRLVGYTTLEQAMSSAEKHAHSHTLDLGEPVDEYSFYETYWGSDRATWDAQRKGLERCIDARFNGEVFALR